MNFWKKVNFSDSSMLGPNHRGRQHVRIKKSEDRNDPRFIKEKKLHELAAIHVWGMINNENGFTEVVWLTESVTAEYYQ